jgi:hypothetical protein
MVVIKSILICTLRGMRVRIMEIGVKVSFAIIEKMNRL